MTIEERLIDALGRTEEYLPSPDLFAKVQRSIQDDAAHRRRVRRALVWIAAGAALVTGWVVAFLDIGDGAVTMPWWALEVLTAAILAVLVIVLGPLIRRFGSVLIREVFGSNPATGSHFLTLLDIAYYLIFAAFILMTSHFSPPTEWQGRLAAQVEYEVQRAGGLLLIMGVLHALTIAALPVIRLIFASSWRRAIRAELSTAAPQPGESADRADRVATVIVWLAAAAFGALVLLNALPIGLGAVFGVD